jgi:hypothetical protein
LISISILSASKDQPQIEVGTPRLHVISIDVQIEHALIEEPCETSLC